MHRSLHKWGAFIWFVSLIFSEMCKGALQNFCAIVEEMLCSSSMHEDFSLFLVVLFGLNLSGLVKSISSSSLEIFFTFNVERIYSAFVHFPLLSNLKFDSRWKHLRVFSTYIWFKRSLCPVWEFWRKVFKGCSFSFEIEIAVFCILWPLDSRFRFHNFRGE